MEFNRSSIEKSHQTLQSSEDTHSQANYSGHVIRSYTCTFCKRGFSNAQALGGHMNIHRKDRAKLKEFPEGNHQALVPDDPSSAHVKPSEEKGGSPRGPRVLSEEDGEASRGKDGAGGVKQLCLFFDKHRSTSENDAEKRGRESSDQGSSCDQELDLELRLGLDQP